MDIGARIRQLRKDNGMSSMVLAELLGVTPPAISQIETGKRSTTIQTLQRLSEIFKVDIAYFVSDSPTQSHPIPIIKPTCTAKDYSKNCDTCVARYLTQVQPHYPPEYKAKAIEMEDESMAPYIQKGDIIVFSSRSKYKDNSLVVVIRNAGNILVRRLHKADKETAVLMAYNQSFPPITLKFADIPYIMPVLSRFTLNPV